MPKDLDIKAFVEEGYLHELNRQVLHPLGLALYVVAEEDGTTKLGGVWDYRDFMSGLIFDDTTLSPEKAKMVEALAESRRAGRKSAFGFWVQPVLEKT